MSRRPATAPVLDRILSGSFQRSYLTRTFFPRTNLGKQIDLAYYVTNTLGPYSVVVPFSIWTIYPDPPETISKGPYGIHSCQARHRLAT